MRCPFLFTALSLILCQSMAAAPSVAGSPGDPAHRQGDEIIICGQLFHTGTPVVLFSDPGGYDGSKHTGGSVTRRIRYATSQPATTQSTTQATTQATTHSATAPIFETLRGPSVTLPELRQHVDQFVLHFDVCGVSKECYRVLEVRRLSVHFMLDLDGTIYQTLDLKEEAYHATIANSRSIGVEIANVGTWEGPLTANIKEWYQRQGTNTRITVPAKFGSLHVPNFVGHPARPFPVGGMVQGRTRLQYDYTPEQYAALAHLGATLCTVFPKIQPDYPRAGPATRPSAMQPTTKPYPFAEVEQPGVLIPHVLPLEQYEVYQGILGHYHVQLNKDDPGPAMQWDKLMLSIRALMTPAARAENVKWRHQPAGVGPTRPTTQPATQPATGRSD